MDRVEIQVQVVGVWQTYSNTLNDPQYILLEFKNAKNTYPDLRVRAIDSNGRLIDMMI